LDQEVQGLKKDVVDLNKDLFVLQEELLFPANTQVALEQRIGLARLRDVLHFLVVDLTSPIQREKMCRHPSDI